MISFCCWLLLCYSIIIVQESKLDEFFYQTEVYELLTEKINTLQAYVALTLNKYKKLRLTVNQNSFYIKVAGTHAH